MVNKFCFNPHCSRQALQRVISSFCYLEFGKHENLKALCISLADEYSKTRDYTELVYAVPTVWLRYYAKKYLHVNDLDWWLCNEYTTDDSIEIFEAAVTARKVVMVDFT